MPRLTILTAAVLIAVGVLGYVLAGRTSVTALIPAFLGVPLLLTGLWATTKPGHRMHAMHAAALLALIGIGGSASGIPKLIAWLGGTEPARPGAVIAQSIMAVVLALFLSLAIKSFIDARRNRIAGSR